MHSNWAYNFFYHLYVNESIAASGNVPVCKVTCLSLSSPVPVISHMYLEARTRKRGVGEVMSFCCPMTSFRLRPFLRAICLHNLSASITDMYIMLLYTTCFFFLAQHST